jgi:hypothetical protein
MAAVVKPHAMHYTLRLLSMCVIAVAIGQCEASCLDDFFRPKLLIATAVRLLNVPTRSVQPPTQP